MNVTQRTVAILIAFTILVIAVSGLLHSEGCRIQVHIGAEAPSASASAPVSTPPPIVLLKPVPCPGKHHYDRACADYHGDPDDGGVLLHKGHVYECNDGSVWCADDDTKYEVKP